MQKPNDKDGSEINKMLCSAKLWKRCLCCLRSDPNFRKECMNSIFIFWIHLQTRHNLTQDFLKDRN